MNDPFLWATVLQTGPTYKLIICIYLSISPLCYWLIPQRLASHWWTLMRHWKLSLEIIVAMIVEMIVEMIMAMIVAMIVNHSGPFTLPQQQWPTYSIAEFLNK